MPTTPPSPPVGLRPWGPPALDQDGYPSITIAMGAGCGPSGTWPRFPACSGLIADLVLEPEAAATGPAPFVPRPAQARLAGQIPWASDSLAYWNLEGIADSLGLRIGVTREARGLFRRRTFFEVEGPADRVAEFRSRADAMFEDA